MNQMPNENNFNMPDTPQPKKKKPFYKKWWFIVLLIIIALFVLLKCCNGKSDSDNTYSSQEEIEEFKWEGFSMHEKLPEPKSTKGKDIYDHSDSLSLTVCKVSKDDYNEYVEKCEFEYGYTIDKSKTSTSFSATNKDQYEVYISYYSDDKEMHISLSEKAEAEESDNSAATEDKSDSSESEKAKTTESSASNAIDKEFKEAMDSYEDFMDEYVSFMKKYQANPSDATLLLKYSEYFSKYSDMCEEFEEWEDEDLNEAELAYYAEVQMRVSKKLMTVAE